MKIRKEALICLKELSVVFLLKLGCLFIFFEDVLWIDFAISWILTYIIFLGAKLFIIGIIERVVFDVIKESVDKLDEETEIKFETLKQEETKQ